MSNKSKLSRNDFALNRIKVVLEVALFHSLIPSLTQLMIKLQRIFQNEVLHKVSTFRCFWRSTLPIMIYSTVIQALNLFPGVSDKFSFHVDHSLSQKHHVYWSEVISIMLMWPGFVLNPPKQLKTHIFLYNLHFEQN